MKTAIVAGGAGFIGSHLCDFLLKRNYKVIAIDNLITGSTKNIHGLKHDPNFEFIEADISKSIEKLADVMIDEIYNLACPASPRFFSSIPVFILKTSSEGHTHLLDLAKSKSAKILLASSSEVYGDSLLHPQEESYRGNVSSTGPRSCYDEGKRVAEALSMAYHKEFGIQTRIARIFNTYGPRMSFDDGRVIPNFFMQALMGKPLSVYGSGQQTRSLCYVSDLVKGLFLLMQSSEVTPVNLGNPDERTVLEISQAVLNICDKSGELIFQDIPEDEPKKRKPDIQKAERILNWRPEVDLQTGLSYCHSYFLEEMNR